MMLPDFGSVGNHMGYLKPTAIAPRNRYYLCTCPRCAHNVCYPSEILFQLFLRYRDVASCQKRANVGHDDTSGAPDVGERSAL